MLKTKVVKGGLYCTVIILDSQSVTSPELTVSDQLL